MTDTVTRPPLRTVGMAAWFEPFVPDAMAWADEHVDVDRITYLDVLAAYCAGRRAEREDEP